MTKAHTIGYELTSKQVRAYETNDLNSVGRALSVNTQEYLAFEGIEEESPLSYTDIFLQITASGVGAYLFIAKVTPWGNPVATVACFTIFATIVGGMFLNAYIQQSEGVIFQSTGTVRQNPPPKPHFAALQGKRMRLLLESNPFDPEVKFVAQIIGTPHFFRAPKIIKSVEKKVQFGKYFGSTGFFYPPALTRDIDSLLERLGSSKK